MKRLVLFSRSGTEKTYTVRTAVGNTQAKKASVKNSNFNDFFIDPIIILEPNLLIPGKKPVGNVKLDPSSFVSKLEQNDVSDKAAMYLYFTGTKRDWSKYNNSVGTYTGAKIHKGHGLRFPSSSHRVAYSDQAGLGNVDQTFAIVFTPLGYGGGNQGHIFVSHSATIHDRIYLHSTAELIYRGGGVHEFDELTFEWGTTYVVILTNNTATSRTYCHIAKVGMTDWIQRVTELSTMNTSATAITLGNSLDYNENFNGTIHLYINDHRLWSDDEIRSFIHDPYQFLIPAGLGG